MVLFSHSSHNKGVFADRRVTVVPNQEMFLTTEYLMFEYKFKLTRVDPFNRKETRTHAV